MNFVILDVGSSTQYSNNISLCISCDDMYAWVLVLTLNVVGEEIGTRFNWDLSVKLPVKVCNRYKHYIVCVCVRNVDLTYFVDS